MAHTGLEGYPSYPEGRRAVAVPVAEIMARMDPALTYVEQELRIVRGEAESEHRS